LSEATQRIPVYRSLGTKRKTKADALENVLVKLHDRGRLDLVTAFLDGDVSIEELAESQDSSRIHELTAKLSEQDSPLPVACTEALRLKAPATQDAQNSG
jgi:predicted transcriptional regulator